MQRLTVRRSVLLMVASTLALAACEQQGAGNKAAAPPAMPPVEVGVVTLHPKSVAITATLPGRVTPSLVAEIRPQVSGIIKARPFSEGSDVTEGSLLYQIDPDPYQASYDSAEASLRKAQAAVPSAEAKVTRYQGLAKEKAVSQQDLDDAVASLAQANAEVLASRAALESARINLANTRVTAPISGRVSKSEVTVGALVTSGQTTALTTVRKLDPINVDLTTSSASFIRLRRQVMEGKLQQVGVGVDVRLILEDGSNYPQVGHLEFTDVKVDEATGTYTQRIAFPNPEKLLLPGMYVRAVLQEGVAPGSFLVPQRAVSRNTKGEPTALFLTAENKVEERVLGARRTIGPNWLVDTGVKDGDRVIVEGTMKVRRGATVNPLEMKVDEATGEVTQNVAPAPDTTNKG